MEQNNSSLTRNREAISLKILSFIANKEGSKIDCFRFIPTDDYLVLIKLLDDKDALKKHFIEPL